MNELVSIQKLDAANYSKQKYPRVESSKQTKKQTNKETNMDLQNEFIQKGVLLI